MRKLTVAAAVALLAASLSFVPWQSGSPDAVLGSISPHELTLAGPAMTVGQAPDAF